MEVMRGNDRYCIYMNHLKGRLDMFWVLLNSQSTVHIFWNTMFLVNVCKTNKRLELLTNTGSTIINEISELPGVGAVWVHQKGIVNILSFHGVQEVNKFEINYSIRPNALGKQDKSF